MPEPRRKAKTNREARDAVPCDEGSARRRVEDDARAGAQGGEIAACRPRSGSTLVKTTSPSTKKTPVISIALR